MNDHDLTQGVAVRLSALCLTDAGKLRRYDIGTSPSAAPCWSTWRWPVG